MLFNVDADDLLQGGEGLACVPEKRDQFRLAVAQALEYARLLKPVAINILPGRCFNEQRKQDYLETFQKNLCFAVEAFAALGIKTVFEAINSRDMPGFIIDNGQQMLGLLDRLKRPGLFMQYDIYHAQMMGERPDEFIARHADKIGHIQFADSPGRGQPGTGRIGKRLPLHSACGHRHQPGSCPYRPGATTADPERAKRGAAKAREALGLTREIDAEAS